MKKIIIFTVLLIGNFSCSSSIEEKQAGKIEESSEIVSEYADTLQNSIGDTRSVVDDMNIQTEKLNQKINEQ